MSEILGNNEVHVWKVSLDVPLRLIIGLYQLLSPDECQRANRFFKVKDRNRFIVGRGTLRKILSTYLSIPPNKLQFNYNKYGKPSISERQNLNNIVFNLSHSNNIALYAVTCNRRVGVDIEFINENFATLDIAKSFFSEEEVNMLQVIPIDQRAQAFFNCWSRKESYIKAIGMGVSYSLDKFTVSLAPEDEPALLKIDADENEHMKWKMYQINVIENYVASVIIENPPVNLKIWNWNLE